MSRPTHRILLLGSNPDDTERLNLEAERAAIDAELRASDRRDDFDVQIAGQADAVKLPGLIMRFQPRILHFSGHGSDEGELIFQRANGTRQPADKQTVARVFGVLAGTIQCVVLNSCYSQAQALLISEHVDVVIGMRLALQDRSAIAFSAGFYEALGYGKSFAVAFELAKARIALMDLPDEDQPVMYVRDGVDPATVKLPSLVEATNPSRDWARPAIVVGALLLSSTLVYTFSRERIPDGAKAPAPGSREPTTIGAESEGMDSSDEDDGTGNSTAETLGFNERQGYSSDQESTSGIEEKRPQEARRTREPPQPDSQPPIEAWKVIRISDVAPGDSKRIELEGPALPASGVLRLRTPTGDDRRFVSDVKCRIESGSPAWCMLVAKPGNDGLEVEDILELRAKEAP